MKKSFFLILLIFMVFNITACSQQKVKYDAVDDFKQELAKVCINEKWGLINTKGELVAKIKYNEINIITSNLIIAKNENKYGCINENGNTVVEFKYDNMNIINHNLLKTESNNKFGIIDIDGKVILDTIYDDIFSTQDSDLIVIVKNKKYGFMNNEKVIIKPMYEHIDFCFSNYQTWYSRHHELAKDYLKVRYNKRYGIMDSKGNFVIEPKFYDITGFSEGIAIVKKESNYGFASIDGRVIKPQYKEVYSFKEGLAPVNVDSKWGYIDKYGNYIISPQYKAACSFTDGLAVTIPLKNSNDQLIDKKGNIIIKPLYDRVIEQNHDLFIVKDDSNDKYGLYKSSGEIVKRPIYDSVRILQDKLVIISVDNKSGIIDFDGKEILPIIYDDIGYENNFIQAKINDKYALFDKSGKKITDDLHYDFVFNANYDTKDKNTPEIFIVIKDKKYGLIDSNGKIIISPEFDYISHFSEGFAAVKINDKWGFIDKEFKFIKRSSIDY